MTIAAENTAMGLEAIDFELLALYRWPIACSLVVGVFLAWTGAQTTSRKQGLQVICISQGALLGSLLGLLAEALAHRHQPSVTFGMGMTLAFGLLTGFLCSVVYERDPEEKPNFLMTLFTVLVALNALVSALAPQVESHMSQLFFGDLATLSNDSAQIIFGCTLPLLVLSWWRRYRDSDISFRAIMLKESHRSSFIWTTVLIALSVQWFGFLFTMGMFFIPTVVSRIRFVAGLNRHYIITGIGSFIGVGFGFMASVLWERVPTVPMVLCCTVIMVALVSWLPVRFWGVQLRG